MKDHIIVIGAGKFGSFLANDLSAKGEDVVLIDKKKEAFKNVSDEFAGLIVNDDAFEMQVLEEAEISKAAQVIIVTNSDNANIFLANVCSTIYHVPQIFIRQSNEDKAPLLSGTNIKVIYPFRLSVDKYYDSVKGGE